MKSIIMQDSEPMQRLANGIVYQAVEDYRAVLKRQKKLQHKRMSPGKRAKEQAAIDADRRELELFFHSKWYATLTSVDPDMILDSLLEEAEV